MIIYDCEIVKAIPNKDGSKLPEIAYCTGWRDFPSMGISVIGAYDYETDAYRVFCKDNFGLFLDLIAGRQIVGFNSIPFDNQLVNATLGITIPEERSYDLLREAWSAWGLGPEFNYKTHGGFGLDALCETNFGTKKSGSGAFAPVLWQQGKIGEVIDYCLNDVRLTKQLMDAVLAGKLIKHPKGGPEVAFRKPS